MFEQHKTSSWLTALRNNWANIVSGGAFLLASGIIMWWVIGDRRDRVQPADEKREDNQAVDLMRSAGPRVASGEARVVEARDQKGMLPLPVTVDISALFPSHETLAAPSVPSVLSGTNEVNAFGVLVPPRDRGMTMQVWGRIEKVEPRAGATTVIFDQSWGTIGAVHRDSLAVNVSHSPLRDDLAAGSYVAVQVHYTAMNPKVEDGNPRRNGRPSYCDQAGLARLLAVTSGPPEVGRRSREHLSLTSWSEYAKQTSSKIGDNAGELVVLKGRVTSVHKGPDFNVNVSIATYAYPAQYIECVVKLPDHASLLRDRSIRVGEHCVFVARLAGEIERGAIVLTGVKYLESFR